MAVLPAIPKVQWEFSPTVRILSHDGRRTSWGGHRDSAWRRGPHHASQRWGRSLHVMPVSLVEGCGLASPRVTGEPSAQCPPRIWGSRSLSYACLDR